MRYTIAFAALLALSASAQAASKSEADKAVADFMAAKGFEAVAEDQLGFDSPAYAKRFPAPGASALLPDSEVGPIEKALLAVETLEKTQPERVRYAVSYGQVMEGDGEGKISFISLVEVRRYNLGPLIHKATQDDYGPENTADVSEFGVGPDVAWRFAFAPVMGNQAIPLSISRRVIADGADQMKVDASEQCPTGPCREVDPGVYGFDLREAGNKKAEAFKDVAAPDIGKPAFSQLVGEGEAAFVSVAYMGRMTSTLLNLTEKTDQPGTWRLPETPEYDGTQLGRAFLQFQFDQNLGQDIFTLALGGQIYTSDDSIAQTWAKTIVHRDLPPDPVQIQIVRR